MMKNSKLKNLSAESKEFLINAYLITSSFYRKKFDNKEITKGEIWAKILRYFPKDYTLQDALDVMKNTIRDENIYNEFMCLTESVEIEDESLEEIIENETEADMQESADYDKAHDDDEQVSLSLI